MTGRWVEVGNGVLVRRYAELDLSVGLVLGEAGCLVVDTRGDVEQGAELATSVREVTAAPWQVVLTHAHFDHCLGTAALLPAPVWAHPGCRDDLAEGGARQHAEALRHTAVGGDASQRSHPHSRPVHRPVVPDRTVARRAELDLGGRRVVLSHPGLGHTDHDLVVSVPDAGVVFAGDLVEQGAPPAFEDAHPLQWPDTVTAMLALDAATFVPGHGEPVDRRFVVGQRAELAELAAGCRAVLAGERAVAELLRHSPFDEETTRTALRRCGAGNP